MTEKQIERGVVDLFKMFGCEFMHFSQPRHSMQTYGIPDLCVFDRRRKVSFWFEVKRPAGIQSKHQQNIEALVTACGQRYFIGGLIEAVECANEMLDVKMEVPPGDRWKGKKAALC